MPELPEVEIVKRSLDRKIKFKKINKVVVRNRNLRFRIPKNFEFFLKYKKINKILRKSKYLIFNLNNNTFFIVHLGMSGTIHLVSNKNYHNSNTSFYGNSNLPKKHNHILIFFRKIKLVYNDPRRFGFFKIFSSKKKLFNYFNKYGPEPFDKKFNINYLKKKLKGKSKNIKNYLLDQKFVSGIGNIYASEILFFCKINPSVESRKLSLENYKKLIYYSKYILKSAIKKGGSTIKNFTNTDGKFGSFQKNFNVYQRENLKCLMKNCSGIIKKKIISNRSTFYCNICQK